MGKITTVLGDISPEELGYTKKASAFPMKYPLQI